MNEGWYYTTRNTNQMVRDLWTTTSTSSTVWTEARPFTFELGPDGSTVTRVIYDDWVVEYEPASKNGGFPDNYRTFEEMEQQGRKEEPS